jgi:hypothetical protein
MELLTLLRPLKLGSDVAEQDSQLDVYFVPNTAFNLFVDDEADIILGSKGAGKSAICRQILQSANSINELDTVDVIAAFNINGSVIFRRLASEMPSIDEGAMRTAWTVYILALIGNHIIDTYPDGGYSSDVSARLLALGLRFDTDRPKSVWSMVMNTLRRMAPTRLEASLTANAIGQSATGKMTFDIKEGSSTVDWESLLELLIDTMNHHGRKVWLMFDRLDEAFPHDRELEQIALRALLQTHRDICSYGSTIKTKLFLRTDLLDRITQGGGFVNATHLRMHRISWDHESIVDFVARRVLGSPDVSAHLNIASSDLENVKDRWRAFHSIVPAELGGSPDDSAAWLITYTSDASGQANPRNILTLLREARAAQMAICDREHLDFLDGSSLLSKRAIRSGQKAVGRIRLEDTLYAEFNALKPWIEALRGRPFRYRPLQFALTMGFSDPAELQEIISDLKYCGFFRQSPNGELSVPLLYRGALGMTEQTGQRTTKAPSSRRPRS